MGWLFHALLSSDTYHHPGMDCTWGSKEEQRRLGLPLYDSTTSRGAEGAAPAGNVAIMCRKDHYAGGTGSQSPAGYVAHANAEWRHECWRELYLLMGFHMPLNLFKQEHTAKGGIKAKRLKVDAAKIRTTINNNGLRKPRVSPDAFA